MIRMLTTSSGSAVGICARITPFWSFSSSRAAGTILKLAAIGVINVPQKPASMPTAPITAGSPPYAWISSGTPIAAVITGKAAKALPMIIVNSAMPRAKTSDGQRRCCPSE